MLSTASHTLAITITATNSILTTSYATISTIITETATATTSTITALLPLLQLPLYANATVAIDNDNSSSRVVEEVVGMKVWYRLFPLLQLMCLST